METSKIQRTGNTRTRSLVRKETALTDNRARFGVKRKLEYAPRYGRAVKRSTGYDYGAASGYRRRRLPMTFRRGGRSWALRNLRTGGLLSIENKFLDCGLTPTAVLASTTASTGEVQPDSGCTGCLSAPAQGDGSSQRDGKQIALNSIQVKGNVALTGQSSRATLGSDSVPTIFLALVLSSQTNGETINSEDVFTNISAEAAAAPMPFANMSNTSRFRVLKRMVIPASRYSALIAANNASATTISWIGVSCPFSMYVNLKGIKVNFTASSTTADVANVVDNSIHLVAFASSGTMTPTLSGASRLRFIG